MKKKYYRLLSGILFGTLATLPVGCAQSTDAASVSPGPVVESESSDNENDEADNENESAEGVGTEIADETEPVGENTDIVTDDITETVDESANSTSTKETEMGESLSVAAANLAIKMLKEGDRENKLVSPISVLMAMGMTANGAKNETREEILKSLGLSLDVMNSSMRDYLVDDGEIEKQLSFANGIWVNGDGQLNDSFLKTMDEDYKAEINVKPFDGSTADEINTFVDKNTDGQIKKLVDDVPSGSSMVLVDALSFDGKWEKPFDELDIDENAVFTTMDGTEQDAVMLHGRSWDYIELGDAKGFAYDYAGDKYSFVAVLPKEGEKISDFYESISGEDLMAAYNNRSSEKVNIGIPEFEFDYDLELGEMFKKNGVQSAFDPSKADFTGMYKVNEGQFISAIIHKTHIALDREGTKAAAVTGVMVLQSAPPSDVKPLEVILDRPFIYMIMDKVQGIPVFMGQVDSLK